MKVSWASILLISVICCGFLAGCSCGDDDDDDSDDDAADDATDDTGGGDDDASDDTAATDDATDDTDDDDATDDTSDDDDGTEIFSISFDNYAVGDLPSPWGVDEPGASYFTVIADPTARAGNVLEMSGDTGLDARASAEYPFSHTQGMLDVSVDTYSLGGSALFFTLFNAADSVVEIWREPNAKELMAWSSSKSEILDCTTLEDNVWYNITLLVDMNAWTFDVLVDGGSTSCNDITLYEDTPREIVNFQLWDGASEGYGGIVYYDNIVGVKY
jgi:hypothetical protein